MDSMTHKLLVATAIALCWLGAAWAVDPETALQSHNQVRADVNIGAYPGQPLPDPPLPLLSWDQALADQARAYAQQCVWAHSDDRINVGENLAYSTDLSFSIEQAVGLWAEEYEGYDFASGSCSIDQCGHYTQLVWQNTLLVGCGDAVCAPLRAPTGVPVVGEARYHVCRYATAGNINGERPYVITGDDPTLTAEYSELTGELKIPYVLIWQPDNIVWPMGGLFELMSAAPVRFELLDLGSESFRDDIHVSIYDVNTTRLFLPHVDTLLGGFWQRHSAVLRYVPGTVPFLLELEYFR
jgi:hypothetical protein